MTDARTPSPPADLHGDARRAWRALVPKLITLRVYLPIDRVALAMFCESWSLHLGAARGAAAAVTERDRAAWAQIRDDLRIEAREFAAAFLVLKRERVRLGAIDADGVDCELRRLFTPGVAVRRAPLTFDEAARLDAWNGRAGSIAHHHRRRNP